MAAKNKPNELTLTRIYDAPLGAVWDAWTDPEQVKEWWGPRGFTITTHSRDLRTGGTWRYTMHGPDGVDYPNTTKYLEVEARSRLVYDHGGSDDRAPLFRVTVNFSEKSDKTLMELTMALATPEAAAETKRFVKKVGGDATWDRLAEHLAKAQDKDRFFINHSFDVPRAVMYELWTDPEELLRWLPPAGFTMKFLRADLRAGGSTFCEMSNGDGLTMYGRARYLELQKPERLVYTQEFCDEKENVVRHPLSPTWPASMRTTVTLAEEGPDRTRVTVEWQPHGETTPEELATFLAARGSMTQGWTGSFDNLEALSNHGRS